MIRKTIILVLSLASIATIVMGVLSQRTDGWVAYHTTKYRIVGQIDYGRAGVEFRRYRCLQCSGRPLDHVPACSYAALPWAPHADAVPFASIPQSGKTPGAPRRSKLGFRWDKWVSLSLADEYAFEADNWGIQVPSVCLFILLAAYPVIALIRGPLRRRRRRKRGLCLTCGYDLTGNESGVCPECAAKVEG